MSHSPSPAAVSIISKIKPGKNTTLQLGATAEQGHHARQEIIAMQKLTSLAATDESGMQHAGKVDLAQHIGVVDQAVGAVDQGVGEVGPGYQRRQANKA